MASVTGVAWCGSFELRACAALVARIGSRSAEAHLDRSGKPGTLKTPTRSAGYFCLRKLAQNAFQRLDDFVALDTGLPKLSFRLNCLDGGGTQRHSVGRRPSACGGSRSCCRVVAGPGLAIFR